MMMTSSSREHPKGKAVAVTLGGCVVLIATAPYFFPKARAASQN
jgi:hypothetical protein